MSYFNRNEDGQPMPYPNYTPEPEDSTVYYRPEKIDQATWDGLSPGMKKILGVQAPCNP